MTESKSASFESHVSTFSLLAASWASGAVARICLHPIDTCKSKLQVQSTQTQRESFPGVFMKTFRKEGMVGLYRGFWVTFIGSSPAIALYFTVYETSKSLLQGHSNFIRQNNFIAQFLSGFAAETVSCLFWTPTDMMKARFQVHSDSNHPQKNPPSYREAFGKIWRNEGFLGFYRGYGATLFSFGPYSAFYLMFYDQLKYICQKIVYKDQSSSTGSSGSSTVLNQSIAEQEKLLPFGLTLLIGAAAAALSAFITNPLDVAKVRIQVQREHKFSFGYRNIFHALAGLWKQEGFFGLVRGSSARVAFQAPATALTLALYEYFKIFFEDMKRRLI